MKKYKKLENVMPNLFNITNATNITITIIEYENKIVF